MITPRTNIISSDENVNEFPIIHNINLNTIYHSQMGSNISFNLIRMISKSLNEIIRLISQIDRSRTRNGGIQLGTLRLSCLFEFILILRTAHTFAAPVFTEKPKIFGLNFFRISE